MKTSLISLLLLGTLLCLANAQKKGAAVGGTMEKATVKGEAAMSGQQSFSKGQAAMGQTTATSNLGGQQEEEEEEVETVPATLETFEQVLALLRTPSQMDRTYLEAISLLFHNVFPYNYILLPTAEYSQSGLGVSDISLNMFNSTIQRINEAINGLDDHIDFSGASKQRTGTPSSLVHALQARNVLMITWRLLETLSQFTRMCDPNINMISDQSSMQWQSARNNCLAFLTVGNDESGKVIDTVVTDIIGSYMKEIRSPFSVVGSFITTSAMKKDVSEVAFRLPVLSEGQCTGIVKEFLGIKGNIRAATPSPFVYPLMNSNYDEKQIGLADETQAFQSRFFTSYDVNKKFWVFEWLPTQLLSTITYCYRTDEKAQSKTPYLMSTIDNTLVHMREALNFWRVFSIDFNRA